MGIFKAFQKANQTLEDAKKDVRRPTKDEVVAKRQEKQQGGGKK